MIKKIFITTLIFFILLCNPVFASNTKSFRNTSSQWASITDANQTGLDFSGDFTFETWIKFNDLYGDANYEGITGKLSVGNASWQLFMYNSSGSKLRAIHYGESEQSKLFSWTPSDDTWYHLAVVFDVGSSITCYVDGSSIGSQSLSNTYTVDAAAPVVIGSLSSTFTATYLLDGWLDETIYWSDVRTSTEIGESYNSGDGKEYTGSESGMVGYWRFEDDLLDETSNDNDLTNNNSGTYSTDVPFSGSTPATRRIISIE